MNIEMVKQITANKIASLERLIDVATQAGDLEGVVNLQNEMNETKLTLEQLNKVE